MPPGFNAAPAQPDLVALGTSLSAIAAEAAALPEPYIQALAPILTEARAELSRDLARWLRTVEDGAERFTAQRYRQALAAISSALEVIETRLPVEAEGTLIAQEGAAGALALEHLHREILLFSGQFGAAVTPIALSEAAMVAQGRRVLWRYYRTSAARYAGNVARDLRQQLAVGLARGETFDELTNRLRRNGGPRGPVALRGIAGKPGAIVEHISEGLFRQYRHCAERLARTEGLRAYNVHFAEDLIAANKEDRGYLKRWDAAADRRLCPICRSLDGQVRHLHEAFADGSTAPPAHPNCRCALTPWREEWSTKPRRQPKPQSVPAYRAGLDTTRHIRVNELNLRWMGQTPQIRDPGRAAPIRQAYRLGTPLPPIRVVVMPNGRLDIDDGVHRYVVARDEFPQAVIPVRFIAGWSGVTD